MQPHEANAISKRVIVRGDHSALASCKCLGGIKTECRHRAPGPNVSSFVLGRDRVCSVLNNRQTPGRSEVQYGIHTTRVAGKVNRHNDPGFRGDFSFGIFQAQIEMERINIHQHRLRFKVRRHFCRRGKGQSGN